MPVARGALRSVPRPPTRARRSPDPNDQRETVSVPMILAKLPARSVAASRIR